MATDLPHDLLIYRMGGNGPEVFTLAGQACIAVDGWPFSEKEGAFSGKKFIALEPARAADGTTRRAVAVEADWHEIPSLRALVHEDYRVAKGKLKEKLRNALPLMEQGAYVAIKDAFKKAAPEQYQFLKELKDILLEKNCVANI